MKYLHESFNLYIDIIIFFLGLNFPIFQWLVSAVFWSSYDFLGRPRGTKKTPNYLQTDEKDSGRYQSRTDNLKFCGPAKIIRWEDKNQPVLLRVLREKKILNSVLTFINMLVNGWSVSAFPFSVTVEIPEAGLSTTDHHDDQPRGSEAQPDVEDDIARITVLLQVIVDFLLQAINLSFEYNLMSYFICS